MSYYRKPAPNRNLSETEREAWLAEIERRYDGLTFRRPNEVFADSRRGYVYAGSEYVATLGATNDPADARDWAPSILAIPYHLAGEPGREWTLDGGRS